MKTLSAVKTRNSNIEMLRALAMLMIVAYHYSIYGFYAEDLMYTNNKIFVDIFGMGGKIGTDLFVLISGYYMVNSRFDVKKLFLIMGQLWFYSIGALLIFILLEGKTVLNGEVIKLSLFPIVSSHYWFITYYVILLFCSPFLNVMVNNLSKNQHFWLCILLFGLCSLIPELFHLRYADGSLPLFVALYVSAAYCRMHVVKDRRNVRISTVALFLLLAFCVLRIIITDLISQQNYDSDKLASSVEFMGAYSPFAFVIAVLLLVLFSCYEARNYRFISFLGRSSLGVYLLHDNAMVRDVLWQDILHTANYVNSDYLMIHAIVSVLGIFAVGIVIDTVRQATIAPLWENAVVFAAKKIRTRGKQ